jgi:DNA topoisomerase-1
MQNLVIVESPTKARTLAKYLGKNYVIEASMGHIRDLPKAEIGVDVDKNFSPRYIVPRDKQKTVNNLKKIAAGAKTLWLATDPDREGEAIAWHIAQLLTEKVKAGQEVKRVVFHEITPGAIKEAFTQPRDLDLKLVDAQQARRVLDRLVGYKLSPLLWKKVKSGLSAGRVQSVALRLIVEREREIEAFKAIEYWTIDALLEANKEAKITASLVEYNGKKVEIGNQLEAQFHVSALQKAEYQVSKITKKEVKKYPSPPFTTSTLQQTASNKLGFSAKKIMSVAQFLYEHGLITYMRTDSVNLSTVAISQARDFIQAEFGKEYLPESGRAYKTKSKVAQEAHEAIRPTNMTVKAEQLKTMNGITRDHIRLYDLIWKRMLACQMSEAVLDQTSIDVTADKYLLRASGSVVKFDGWMKLYEKSQESKIKNQEEEGDENQSLEEQDKLLPELKEGQDLSLLKIDPLQHFTEPPARFNDASLIKKLEELGIGRPSTYAPILSTIQERFYVERFEKRLKPTPLGMAVNDFLVKNFSEIVDFRFTANVEDELDEIARGERQWQPTIKEFYIPFAKKLEETGETAERVQIESETVDRNCPTCGKPLQVKYGRFGKFLACTGFPDCKFTDSFEAKLDIPCPQCGGEVVLRKTKKGRPFYGCKNYPTCTFASWNRPEVKAATPS